MLEARPRRESNLYLVIGDCQMITDLVLHYPHDCHVSKLADKFTTILQLQVSPPGGHSKEWRFTFQTMLYT